MKKNAFLVAILFGLVSLQSFANPREIKVDFEVARSPQPSVQISWDSQPGSNSEMQVTIYRRELGVKSGIWHRLVMHEGRQRSFAEMTLFEPIAQLPTQVRRFTDANVELGKQYEYRVHRPALQSRNYHEAATYFVVSLDASLVDQQGSLLLVVDETLVDTLSMDLRLLAQDLAGDGWNVVRLLTPRHRQGDPVALHALIRQAVRENPEIKGLYLFGHVPIARSGFLAPDGHQNAPHETDLYYADLTGAWTDLQLFSNEGGDSRSNIPRDGKFDHSTLPRAIDVMVGRVDLSGLRELQKSEVELLRDYVHKTHAWRNADREVPYRALLNSNHLFQEHSWVRAMFGSSNVMEESFQPRLNEDDYLWAMDFGHWDGGSAEHYIDVQNRAIFMLNFGSGKQKWSGGKNAMRMLLAQPDWGLAVGWGARPAWHMHQMAAGWTVGQSHQRTVNNAFNGGEFFPGGHYSHLESHVHMNLMGDPTLRMHVSQPVRLPQVVREAKGIHLSWQPPVGDAPLGYHVYRSSQATSGFQRLTDLPLAADQLQFVDSSDVVGDVYYQIRAIHRHETRSGTYELASRGAFVWLASGEDRYAPPVATSPEVHQLSDQLPIALRISGVSDHHVVIVSNPQQGLIRWEEGNPVYHPNPDFSGSDSIQYRLFDGVGLSEVVELSVRSTL
ncbi:Ig-like domain-containing protein [Nitrincola schmidtii]|uniref:Ig-like domain-containing protein n=1 Tax=Nitrincola schmidtii TaxID=1730894 RepID=UPI00124DE4E5|nr:Ig-like domain-containing protein [Nitrincola schmidtii]